jgi:hypothetical protein
MALYLFQGSYTAEALATMAKNPQDRSVPVRENCTTLPKRYLKKTSQTGIIRTFADVFCPPK